MACCINEHAKQKKDRKDKKEKDTIILAICNGTLLATMYVYVGDCLLNNILL